MADGGIGARLHGDAEMPAVDDLTASMGARAGSEIFARMQQLTEGRMAVCIGHRWEDEHDA